MGEFMKYGAFCIALSKQPLKQVYLLSGEENYYIEKAKERILTLIDAKDSLTIFENTASLSDIMITLNTPPLFSPKIALLIKDAGIFKEVKTDSKTKDKELEKFIETISNLPPETFLIFILNDKPDKRRKIYKAVEKAGLILESDPVRPWEIDEWLNDKLMSIGKTLDKDAHLFFMNLVGVMKEIKLAYLDKEFDKLALFTDNKRIDKKTMEEVFSSVPEVSSFALMDAVSEKDIKKALLLLRKETESGAFLPLTIGLIARHTRQLLQAKILIKEGVMGKALGAPLGLNPVIAERLGRAAANFNEKVLEDAIILLSDADYLTKTGQGGIELIEEILIRLCKK